MPPIIRHEDEEPKDPLPNPPPGNVLLGVLFAPLGVAMLGAGVFMWTSGDPAYRSPTLAIFFGSLGVLALLGSAALIASSLARGDSTPGAGGRDPFADVDDDRPRDRF